MLFSTAIAANAVDASCPITPQERNLDYRLVQERRAVELRRYGTPDSEPPVCVLHLACQLPEARPVGISYIRCGVTDIRVPQ